MTLDDRLMFFAWGRFGGGLVLGSRDRAASFDRPPEVSITTVTPAMAGSRLTRLDQGKAIGLGHLDIGQHEGKGLTACCAARSAASASDTKRGEMSELLKEPAWKVNLVTLTE